MTRTLFGWFWESADCHPHDVALEVADVTLTYTELRKATERMAALIVSATGGVPARVGVLTSRSLTGCIAYLATQLLGASAVPLNPACPAVRNLGITTAAELDVTIVDDTAGDGAEEYRGRAESVIIDMTGDRWRELLTGVPAAVPRVPEPRADDVAYIIFTSGTTGQPKGVPITHANASSFLRAVIPRYGFARGARVSQTFEMAFDGSILAMFGAWGSGATLCVAERRDVLTPVRFINARRITHWLSVPSLISFATRLRALPPNSMPTLRLSSFGGEALSIEQIRAWSAAAPNSAIINCYGPTETTVIVTAYQVPTDPADWLPTLNGSVPIGNVYPHLEHVLLDEQLEPADEGELCIRGAQRFSGYLNPAEDAGRFLSFDGVRGEIYCGRTPLTDDHWYRTGDRVRREYGELVHLGRVDDQIKVWGHRVELAEIEAVLRRNPAIVDAVVLTIPADDGEVDLHAVYSGGPVGEAGLARTLEQLPVYMRPRFFHQRAEMPLTATDKVDRRQLAEEVVQRRLARQ